jgi:hypothetical protein
MALRFIVINTKSICIFLFDNTIKRGEQIEGTRIGTGHFHNIKISINSSIYITFKAHLGTFKIRNKKSKRFRIETKRSRFDFLFIIGDGIKETFDLFNYPFRSSFSRTGRSSLRIGEVEERMGRLLAN